MRHAPLATLAAFAVGISAPSFAACGGDASSATPPALDGSAPSDAAPTTAPPLMDGGAPLGDDAGAGDPDDAGDPNGGDDAGGADAGEGKVDAGDGCNKHLTVLMSVGVPGHWTGNGCWHTLVADGAANAAFRKCSTSTFQVENGGAANYAYDDTNPTRALSEDQNFLATCSKGATGDGFEYMAYKSGWRVLGGATHLRAFFAELYGDAETDVDSLYAQKGVYAGNAQLAGHTVYPMVNIGPPAASNLEATIQKEVETICKTVKDGGYFGTYTAAWKESWPDDDPRKVAAEKALDACTKG